MVETIRNLPKRYAMSFKTLIAAVTLILGVSSVFAQNSTMTSNQKDENQKKDEVIQADKKDSGKLNPNVLLPTLSGPNEIVVRKEIDTKSQNSTFWDSFWKLPRHERMGIMAIFGVSLLIIFGVSKHFLSRKKSH